MSLSKKAVYVLVSSLLLFGCNKQIVSPSQQQEYDKIEAFYSNAKSQGEPIRLYAENDNLKQILLIRHGNPDLDKETRLGYRGMRQYIYDYDTVHVKPVSASTVQIAPVQIDTIYASSLQRAHDTANQLFREGFVIVADSLFREFEREVVPLPLVKMKPKGWSIWSRFFWVLGLQSSNIEGFGQAKKRTEVIADFLSNKAEHGQFAVLVSHGLLNRYLKKELMKNGWQLSHDGGKEYLSVQVFSKIE